jgi:hypothetical protein
MLKLTFVETFVVNSDLRFIQIHLRRFGDKMYRNNCRFTLCANCAVYLRTKQKCSVLFKYEFIVSNIYKLSLYLTGNALRPGYKDRS